MWSVITKLYIANLILWLYILLPISVSHRCWEHGGCAPHWGGGLIKIWWGGLKSIHGGLKMLSKNAREGVHSIVKLLAISLGGAPHMVGHQFWLGGVQKNNRMRGVPPHALPLWETLPMSSWSGITKESTLMQWLGNFFYFLVYRLFYPKSNVGGQKKIKFYFNNFFSWFKISE